MRSTILSLFVKKLKRLKFGPGGLSVFSVLAAMVAVSSVQASERLTDAVLLIPELDVSLYAAPERGQEPVKKLSSEDFPDQVWHLETITRSGRMHHIRLEQESRGLWVKGTQLMLPGVEGTIKIDCEPDQLVATGYTGRGVGGRTSCKK